MNDESAKGAATSSGKTGNTRKTKKKDAVEEDMDLAIESLDHQATPNTTSDKKSVGDEFKSYELTKARSPSLNLLFSALKSIPPSSTEGRFISQLRFLADKVAFQNCSLCQPTRNTLFSNIEPR